MLARKSVPAVQRGRDPSVQLSSTSWIILISSKRGRKQKNLVAFVAQWLLTKVLWTNCSDLVAGGGAHPSPTRMVLNNLWPCIRKECIWVRPKQEDEPRACYTEWSKSEREKQIMYISAYIWNLQVVLVVKNRPANTGDIKDRGSIPGKVPWRTKWPPTPVY